MNSASLQPLTGKIYTFMSIKARMLNIPRGYSTSMSLTLVLVDIPVILCTF
jgi:hypothetical protein